MSYFDRVDKQFRQPAPIKLECVLCGSTDEAATTWAGGLGCPAEVPLCAAHRRMNENAIAGDPGKGRI